MICFESKSLGDNLAWIPYVEKFRIDNKCKVICSSFNNDLFKNQYPDIEFVLPGSNVNNIHALYRLGLFYNDERKIDDTKHYNDPKKEPLMKVASDILGLTYKELKPKLPKLGKKKKKLVTIAIHSTAQCKYWNYPGGWDILCKMLRKKGLTPVVVEKDELFGIEGHMNKLPQSAVKKIGMKFSDVLNHIQHCEFFIGLSSGLSWVAQGLDKPTVIISNVTSKDNEFVDDKTFNELRDKICAISYLINALRKSCLLV